MNFPLYPFEQEFDIISFSNDGNSLNVNLFQEVENYLIQEKSDKKDNNNQIRHTPFIIEKIGSPTGKKILVLGTEEFMYPAILTGKKIEQNGNFVRTHSTTRSPISVFDSDSASGCKKYPLYSRFTLASLYDEERTTYIYNLDYYDKILIITDSSAGYSTDYSTDSSTDSSIKEKNKKGLLSLINAVRKFSGDISVIRWEK